MRNFISFCLVFILTTKSFAHEQWLLTKTEMIQASQLAKPEIFTQINYFNSAIIFIIIVAFAFWILFNHLFPQKLKISPLKISLSLSAISITTGLMLILCALGLLPKVGIPYFQEPVYLASDLLISALEAHWKWLKWLELILGVAILCQRAARFFALLLLCFVVLGIILFQRPLFQYLGFYLGIIYFLFAATKTNYIKTLSVLQILTGINFIYSAVSVKWMNPTVDIFMIVKHRAFTFGIPADYFVFLMLVTEISFGILIILGYRLRLIGIVLLLFFIFMSINFSENFLSHTFIYGILFTFIITNGIPLFRNKMVSKRLGPTRII